MAVVGGLVVSMALTLFVVPCVYVIVHAAAARASAWLTGSGPALADPAPVSLDAGQSAS